MSKARERAKGVQVVARNRKALFEYEVLEEYEAGLVLAGTEVKSLRDAKVQLLDAYATIDGGEAWLHHLHTGLFSPCLFTSSISFAMHSSQRYCCVDPSSNSDSHRRCSCGRVPHEGHVDSNFVRSSSTFPA